MENQLLRHSLHQHGLSLSPSRKRGLYAMAMSFCLLVRFFVPHLKCVSLSDIGSGEPPSGRALLGQ